MDIKLADRVAQLPPYLFAQLNNKMMGMRRAGVDVIDMAMGNPTDPPENPTSVWRQLDTLLDKEWPAVGKPHGRVHRNVHQLKTAIARAGVG